MIVQSRHNYSPSCPNSYILTICHYLLSGVCVPGCVSREGAYGNTYVQRTGTRYLLTKANPNTPADCWLTVHMQYAYSVPSALNLYIPILPIQVYQGTCVGIILCLQWSRPSYQLWSHCVHVPSMCSSPSHTHTHTHAHTQWKNNTNELTVTTW